MMLVIRHEQMEAFSQAAIDRFKSRLRPLIGPGGGAQPDADAVAARIDREMAFARGFGFTRERDIARYVEIVCTAFPDVIADVPVEFVKWTSAAEHVSYSCAAG
jgi:hypothetical protein